MGKCRSGWAPGDSPQPLGRSLRRAPPQGLSFPTVNERGWVRLDDGFILTMECCYAGSQLELNYKHMRLTRISTPRFPQGVRTGIV